jgi:hypothetical protein
MKTSNRAAELTAFLVCVGAVTGAAFSIPAAVGEQQPAAPPAAFQFHSEQIASDFGIGYAVTTGDVNGDGRTDVVAINATDLVWFEAPTWQKRVILTGATPRDNVCLALHDIDRDGRLDVALGASWQPTNTSSGGTLHWVKQGAPGAEWTLHSIAEEPTLHRIRWADVDGDGNRELIVAPLHGRGTKGPDWQGQGARILIFTPPANPARDPWPVEVADDTLHIVHNFLPVNMDDSKADEILTASREGVTLLQRATKSTIKADSRIKTDLTVAWVRTLIGEGAPGEIKLGRVAGRRMIATVEPWHGKSVVIYADQPGVWARTVIESELTGGHALGWADFDGDGNDELAVGWRDQKPGVAVYAVDREGALKSKLMVDEGGMATEDLVIADLNGDKRPDIIASGRATRNVKIYWNETQARGR